MLLLMNPKSNSVVISRIRLSNQFDTFVTTADRKYRVVREGNITYLYKRDEDTGEYDTKLATMEMNNYFNGIWKIIVISQVPQKSKEETELLKIIGKDQWNDKNITIDTPARLDREFKLKIAMIRSGK